MADILLVESYEPLANAIRYTVEDKGHVVTIAHTLGTSLTQIRENVFQILMVNRELGNNLENKDGEIVAAEFKKTNPNGKIVGMSFVGVPQWKGNCDIFVEKCVPDRALSDELIQAINILNR